MALSGCGASEKERRADWVRDADAACRKAERSIAERGAPATVGDIPALARDGAADARNAIDEVLALDAPEDAAPARSALRDIDADLRQLAGFTAKSSFAELVATSERLEDHVRELEPAARKAGLRTCGRAASHDAVLDARKAPLFEGGFTVSRDDLDAALVANAKHAENSPRAAEIALSRD